MSNSKNSLPPLVPADLLTTALRRWWVVVLGMCLGGLTGAGLHFIFPPIYQARAVISAGVDFSRTGELTDVEEDYMILAVGDLIASDAVVEAALAQANQQGISLDRLTFDKTHFLQRRFTDWLLVVRSHDPQQAAILANLWADAARAAIEDASLHLIQLDQFEADMDKLASCRDLVQSNQPAQDCIPASVDELQAKMDTLALQMQTERLAAGTLVTGTVANLGERAQTPARSQLFGRNLMAFSGMLLGLLLSSLLLFRAASLPTTEPLAS